MYRGAKPRATGIFDAQDVFPPTQFAELYNQGAIPCRVNLKGSDEKPGGPPGGRDVYWNTKIEDIDLDYYLPIFTIGLREQTEPFKYLAFQGL